MKLGLNSGETRASGPAPTLPVDPRGRVWSPPAPAGVIPFPRRPALARRPWNQLKPAVGPAVLRPAGESRLAPRCCQVYGQAEQVTACDARLTTQEGVNGFDFGG